MESLLTWLFIDRRGYVALNLLSLMSDYLTDPTDPKKTTS